MWGRARRCLPGVCAAAAAAGGVRAGPDAVPLVRIAKEVGWHVTVVDGRSHYAAGALPLADALIVAEPTEAPGAAGVTPRSAVVVMTHSYEQDKSLLRALLRSPPAYVGQLGPRSRTERILASWRRRPANRLRPPHCITRSAWISAATTRRRSPSPSWRRSRPCLPAAQVECSDVARVDPWLVFWRNCGARAPPYGRRCNWSCAGNVDRLAWYEGVSAQCRRTVDDLRKSTVQSAARIREQRRSP